jgi:hypothetical protein
MWLGFHDEMADLDSPDPVEHESTRLTCVAADSAQTTMDVAWWQQWIPGYDTPHRDFYKTFDVQLKAAYLKEVADVSALSLVSKGAHRFCCLIACPLMIQSRPRRRRPSYGRFITSSLALN